jgi:hypothetical protein
MEDFLHRGWTALGARSFAHYCGAKAIWLGRQSWIAKKVDGSLSAGHESSEQAMGWIEAHDPDYWTYGSWAHGGAISTSVFFNAGFLDSREKDNADDRDHVAVLYLFKKRKFSRPNEPAFKRLFLNKARCARCDQQPTGIVLRSLPRLEGSRRWRAPHIVCNCGYPVWRISRDDLEKASQRICDAEYSRERKELRTWYLRTAGGKHNVREIQAILGHQGNRCIYCNVPFGNEVRATKDHLIPVVFGGTDWALNIVMACHSCNTRRGTIPFRTYCTILSPTQNRRILNCLGERIAGMEPTNLPDDAFAAFCEGIARHNRKDQSYRRKLRYSAKARRNAAVNELLPPTPNLILRRVNMLLALELQRRSKKSG